MSAQNEVVYDYGFDFETGESYPAAGTETMPAERPPMPAIGARVRLKGCNFGPPGRVLRHERRKVVVYWIDLDFISRHNLASLVQVLA
jgi:hypothetical protein